jgi:hypothetical protein
MRPPLTEKDWQDAADALDVPVAAIKAVAEVEAPGSGFLSSGEPRILFERHKFHNHTGGKWDKTHPNISHPKWGGYGKESAQHGRLQEAAALDREAALKSASWGRFQILGENYKQAGFDTLQAFINAMYRDEASHLRAFVQFLKNDSRLLTALQKRNWATFARYYNGPAFAEHQYDVRLASAYRKWGGK